MYLSINFKNVLFLILKSTPSLQKRKKKEKKRKKKEMIKGQLPQTYLLRTATFGFFKLNTDGLVIY